MRVVVGGRRRGTGWGWLVCLAFRAMAVWPMGFRLRRWTYGLWTFPFSSRAADMVCPEVSMARRSKLIPFSMVEMGTEILDAVCTNWPADLRLFS